MARANKEKKKKKKHNWQIMFVTYAIVFLFLGMMYYICNYAMNNRQELANNSYNTRSKILITQNRRGSIYANDGTVLAKTVTAEDGKEIRKYPFGNEFSHIVGFATNGRAGIEAIANYYLINSNAPLSEKVQDEAEAIKYPGDDVHTTLDVDLQETAYNAMGIYKGAIVVTNPKTGEILAMVSKPDFDPSQIDAMWSSLVADTSGSSILLNRALQGLYPPGSTMKIVTALAYIKEHPDTYNSYNFNCSGSFKKEDETIHCYHGQNHGAVNFAKSFAKSCNSSFANIGTGLDKEEWSKLCDELLFNQELPLSLNYSKSRVTINSNTETSDVMQVSIGQGTTAVTPMHMNLITQAIANDGTLMKPMLINSVTNSQGAVIKSFKPATYKKLISSEEASAMKILMAGVVEHGTASKLAGLSYTAAGKTGSAEFNSNEDDSHAWFTGFAPVDNPEICVTIIIEGAGSGGDYAVPMAKRIFDAYFGE